MILNHDEILRDLEATQRASRLHHILGVLQTCMALGEIHGGDLDRLAAAALLHDCAKHVGREETLERLKAGGIELSEEDLEYPAIWHGPLGMLVAQEKYGVEDASVLNAIQHHTLGCADMDLTLKILMCADFCEPTRTHPGVGDTRNLVRADLDKGLKFVLHAKVNDLNQRGLRPHSRIFDTIRALEN